MTGTAKPLVAVIGAGGIGRGWATLAASRGWQVTLFDASAAIAEAAHDEVTLRVRQMVRRGMASEEAVEVGLESFTNGRSLLQTVTDADWIIESGPEDLAQRQRLLEQVEQVARLAAIITSSSLRYHASALCARLRRPERLLIVNPWSPLEYMPVVEVVPGPLTDPSCVADLRFWMQRLGQMPVVLQAEVPGNVSGRIAAAVWRECIDLVLEGVVSVEGIDRIVSAGPALAWAAVGPHQRQLLAAGERDLGMYLNGQMETYQRWWQDLSTRTSLSAEEQQRLTKAIEQGYATDLPELREERDRRLAALHTVIREQP
ncbi:MAG: 3-hydroxyacyl-CoA dehydrogenase NAD-binding domain-containing protein [Gemmatimonadota bacterium]|nr:3-hydroxyacyl-CoA dehydrogenase NAD-binding domain-containing protein [Gemmatimonadota bacterium]